MNAPVQTPLDERIAAYLQAQLPADALRVTDLKRIHGGASRETYRFKAHYTKNGQPVTRGLVLRRDPTSSLIETERSVEYSAYKSFHGTSVPVPAPVALETDSKWLERPFFVMEEVEGCEAGRFLSGNPYGEHREKIGEQFWPILGEIAKADPVERGLTGVLEMPNASDTWRRELDHWAKVIDEDEVTPEPIVRAAIRRLRRTPPPPAQKIRVVHGDYRTGNFLFDKSGTIRAILDWEMCHLGDPLEDLAWALDPLWAPHDASKPGGMIERDRAIKLWEKASGLKADKKSMEWWTTFSMVKGLAIWISSGREFHDNKNTDPVMAFSSWYCTQFHNKSLAEKLAPKTRAKAA
jgi:aminoglycoside phosphotransferase (APT) family kinase protein